MIPKKIHYIWLGKKNKSRLSQICINSWNRNLKEYKIIEWNENNLKIDKLCKNNRFLEKCYELKLWAFVSDYIRLHILYNEGGIYLDTDVEVVKTFDDFLDDEVFLGYEKENYIGTGIIGAEKGNTLIKQLLHFYDKDIWKYDFFNNPIIFKWMYDKYPELFKKCKIYPREYFAPYSPDEKITNGLVQKKETVAIHWYSGDWNMSRAGYVFLNTKHIKEPIKKCREVVKKNLGYIKKNN